MLTEVGRKMLVLLREGEQLEYAEEFQFWREKVRNFREALTISDPGQIRFLENGILYGCDFHSLKGAPSDINFRVEWFGTVHDRVKLTAPGYGGSPYGNGSIFIFLNHAEEYRERIVAAANYNATHPVLQPALDQQYDYR